MIKKGLKQNPPEPVFLYELLKMKVCLCNEKISLPPFNFFCCLNGILPDQQYNNLSI